MERQVRVRLLGRFEVEGLSEHEVGTRKARTVLKVLALARGLPVTTDRLVFSTWGDNPPADPAGQVAVLVSRLRRVLGAHRLTRTDDGYSLALDWLDVEELHARADEAARRLAAGTPAAARAAARAALDLARGPLLADEEGEWVDVERIAAERAVARVRLIVAEAALASGEPAEASAAADAALDHDPYDESVLRLLMRAHVAAGRPASALAAYARVRHRLAEDLGVDPAPDTEALHTAILRGGEDGEDGEDGVAGVADVADDTRGPRRHPALRRTPLVGRAGALAALDAVFDTIAAGGVTGAGGAAAVLVEGEAGIGKTALVAHWTEGVADRGAVVLRGRCDELGRDLPLQPVLDALHSHLAAVGADAAAELLGAEAGVVGPLVGRAPHPDREAPPDLRQDPDARRAVLYAALLAVVERAAAGHPMVLAIDDLHLASPGTIEWLRLAARRGTRLLVLATARPRGGPSLDAATTIELGPLDVEATAELVGTERAEALHARSGGHPLLLTELAAANDDDLPASIREAVSARASGLGDAGPALRAAAVLGPVIDLDLLATVLRLPAAEALDHLEAAVGARLLDERGGALVFRHELVREALEAAATASRRALIHQEAARALASRPQHDPLEVAWHARLAGDQVLAAAHLVAGGEIAADRFDLENADRLLSDAIALDDITARLARARVRLAKFNPADARVDIERAIALGAGVEALELAGWIAYYARDFDVALAYAGEGMARADDPALRSSCLALAGRIGHSRGEIEPSGALLEEAAAIAPRDRRGLPLIWLGEVRMHQGRLDDAAGLLERALVEPERLGHPFGLPHGLYALAYARGAAGRVDAALSAVDRLAETASGRRQEQGRRFTAVASNMRGWLLRNLGQYAEADDCNALAAGEAPSPELNEPRYAGTLDLVEGRLAVADIAGASKLLATVADVTSWEGVMAWRQRWRYDLLRARVALAEGETATAARLAARVVADAEERGSPRYVFFGRLVAARAAAALHEPVDPATVASDLAALDAVAVPEAWWWTAQMAAALGVDTWWKDAERRVERLAAGAGPHATALRAAARTRFDTLQHGT